MTTEPHNCCDPRTLDSDRNGLAEAPADLKTYRVTLVSRVLEVYEVRAENEEEAEGNLIEGRLCHTDDDLENEILSVEEVKP